MDYKPLVAKSGEVYYTVGGNLYTVASIDEYNYLLERIKKLESVYFEIRINGDYHKLLATRTAAIMQLIMQLPLQEQTKELKRYQETLEEVEQYV